MTGKLILDKVFAESLGKPDSSQYVRYKTGTVTVANPTVGLCDVQIDGTDYTLSDIQCLSSYSPIVGDRVYLHRFGEDILAVGTLNDVPVGGLIPITVGAAGITYFDNTEAWGPITAQTVTTPQTLFPVWADVIAGHIYGVMVDGFCGGAGGVSSSIAYIYVATDDGQMNNLRFGPGSFTGTWEWSFCREMLYEPTTTRNTQFTIGATSVQSMIVSPQGIHIKISRRK